MVDYSLWEVIENGNKPAVTTVIEGVETTIAPTTAIEKRFGGNVAAKKTQRNLLKQQYENFTTSSSEVMIGVTKLKKDLTMHLWHTLLQVLILSEPTVKKPAVETSEAKASAEKPKDVRKNSGPPIIEDWISDSKDETESRPKIKKKIVKPSFAKIEFAKSNEQVKSPRKTVVKQRNQHRQHTNHPRGNQRNWNNMMSQRLKSNFEMYNKACYVCGSFDHLQANFHYHQRQVKNQKMVKPV
uniref:Ribonuclease H-like domain-containing protein n=1 Tax=Tanacetum cinerariifolium TaxID=118510 RepID=A0A6L2MI66_TANCI|nr:ribonuclease H-like domain-containing protein [Tanacetum cinerariifolium]